MRVLCLSRRLVVAVCLFQRVLWIGFRRALIRGELSGRRLWLTVGGGFCILRLVLELLLAGLGKVS